jgi:hypothetical protein
MLLNYGRGRAEQFRLHPTIRSAPNFVPPLFCVYLALFPFLPEVLWWGMVPYCVVLIVYTFAMLPWKKKHWFPIINLLTSLSHVFYGLGFWWGCLTKPKPPSAAVSEEVKLEWVQRFGE